MFSTNPITIVYRHIIMGYALLDPLVLFLSSLLEVQFNTRLHPWVDVEIRQLMLVANGVLSVFVSFPMPPSHTCYWHHIAIISRVHVC